MLGLGGIMSIQQGRPKYGFLLFDCPSDHEIEGSLVTECEVIKAVLSNRKLGSQLKVLRCASTDAFNNLPQKPYTGIRFVHLGGHGSSDGLSLIGGHLSWDVVAQRIYSVLPILNNKELRVLTLSCCHSSTGAKKMKKILAPYFTGIYYFVPDKIAFSRAMTVWCMFYLKKKLDRPHKAVVDTINKFLGEKIIAFMEP